MEYISGYNTRNKYKVLSEKEIGIDGKWYLVECEENFFAYGTQKELQSLYFVPVNQCGTKEKVKEHCEAIIELCKSHNTKYEKEMDKDKSQGWKVLIDWNNKEIEALTDFVEKLS